MLHVRVIAPQSVSARVQQLLADDPAIAHLIMFRGAAQSPAGDVLEFDVVREGASHVLEGLRGLGVDRDGAIVVENVDAVWSASADQAARRTPGLGVDAVVWHEMEQQTGDESALSVSFLAFMSVAMVIAAVGVLLDQPILIVGSMVVGPEFGPLAALCVGLVRRNFVLVRRSAVALAVGFLIGMIVTVGAVWLLTIAGLIDKEMLLEPHPLTSFIWRPDALSWVIGFLGGVAGMLSLTSAKAGTLVGVLISVTTVPAAANAAVALGGGLRGVRVSDATGHQPRLHRDRRGPHPPDPAGRLATTAPSCEVTTAGRRRGQVRLENACTLRGSPATMSTSPAYTLVSAVV